MAALEGDHGRNHWSYWIRELNRVLDGDQQSKHLRKRSFDKPDGPTFNSSETPSLQTNIFPSAPHLGPLTILERDAPPPQILNWLQDTAERPPLGMVRRPQSNKLAQWQPSALASASSTNSIEGCYAECSPEAVSSRPTAKGVTHKLQDIQYHESWSGRDAVSQITDYIRRLNDTADKDNEDGKTGTKVKMLMHWNLPYCLSKFYPCGTRLGDVMTVTGNPDQAYATSCRRYVRESFPGVPERLLLALETFSDRVGRDLSQIASGQFTDKEDSSLSMDGNVSVSYDYATNQSFPHLSLSESMIRFTVAASSEACVQIVCFLSWLCAATQHSDHQELCRSELRWKINDSFLIVRLLPLDIVYRKACWHHLFSNTVIATQFRIPRRFQGQGLEIGLGDMLSLSRSLRMLEQHQCFVAEAPQNLLILMAKVSDDGGYQWHLEEKGRTDIGEGKTKKLTTTEILSRPKFSSCLRGIDINTLKDARHFLGWTPSAEVVLATSFEKPSEINLSGAQRPCHTRTPVTAYNFGIGLSHWGGASFGVTATTSSIATRYAREAEKDLQDTLQDLEHKSVIMFDYPNKIAWQLPTLSVLLYMIQLLCEYRGLCAYDENDNSATHIPIACGNANGGQAALGAIKASLHLRLQRQGKDISFLKLVERVCLSLDIGQHFAIEAWDAAVKHKRAAPKCIVGFELIELVKENTILHVKEELVNQPWAHLAQDGGLVLFCRDIGQAIAPSSKTTL